MPTMTAGRPADADEIHSYDDIVAVHLQLSRKAAAGGDDTHVYYEAADKVRRLGALYREPDTLTSEMRTTAESALAAIRQAARSTRYQQENIRFFMVADTWLDHMSLLVNRPGDGR